MGIECEESMPLVFKVDHPEWFDRAAMMDSARAAVRCL